MLMEWYAHSPNKAINIITVPYRGVDPLLELVESVMAQGDKVLYITGEEKEKCGLALALAAKGETRVSLHQEAEIQEDALLVVCDYNQTLRIKSDYALAIYDDVNSFPYHRKPEMQQLIGFIYPRCKKVMAYSFESVFLGVEALEVPLKDRSGFVTEPRVIETRLNLEEFIPNSIYDYLLWFVFEKRKVLFVTASKKVKRRVSRFLMKVDPTLEGCIYDVGEIGTRKMSILAQDEQQAYIFITDDLDDYSDIPVNFEIVIHGADSARYSYRELLFFCLRSGMVDDINGEVLLLCHGVTRDMEKTREMTRRFNKVIWDEGFQ